MSPLKIATLEFATAISVTIAVVAIGAAGYLWQTSNAEREQYRRHMRAVDFAMAELGGRIRELEDIRIQLDIIDHTGLWLVDFATEGK